MKGITKLNILLTKFDKTELIYINLDRFADELIEIPVKVIYLDAPNDL